MILEIEVSISLYLCIRHKIDNNNNNNMRGEKRNRRRDITDTQRLVTEIKMLKVAFYLALALHLPFQSISDPNEIV
jgi:hypothetical protein